MVSKCGFGLARICSSNRPSSLEKIKHLFDASLRKNGIFTEPSVFGKMILLIDCFQIWFLGWAKHLFIIFTRVYALQLLFDGPTVLHIEQILHISFAYLTIFVHFYESHFARKPCTVYLFRFAITICIVFNNGVKSVVLEIWSNLDDETELGNRAFKEFEETVERLS